jgi:ribosomal protein S12 methylthiotransferase accessory factor
MFFQLPRHNFPQDFLKIHKNLKKQGILGEYFTRFNFPDEPQFFQYVCERSPYSIKVKKGFGYGCGEDESEAFISAVAEAIEHYCILFEREELLIKGSYKAFKDIAVDPMRFVPLAKEQLNNRAFKKFRINESSIINWLEGYSLTNKRKVLVPASLVYANYDASLRREPTIQLGISTGAACGDSLAFAQYRGICEIIERDAYVISFLNKLPKKLIEIDKDSYLVNIKSRVERYNLEVYVLETRLDLSLITTICIILDRTGSGPAVSVGLGGDLDPRAAIKTSIFEAVRRHISSRDRFFRKKQLPLPSKNSFDWFSLQKLLLWSAPHMLLEAEKFIKNEKVSYDELNSRKNNFLYEDKVKHLVDELKRFNYEVICVDVTIPEVKKQGLTVVKMLIPELVPVWKDERYPYLGMQRLYSVPKKLGYEKSEMPITVNDYFLRLPF